jgi:predicted secreted protein
MSSFTITERDDGKTIDVAEGDEIHVRLEEIGGTAFTWKPEHYDASIVSYDQSDDAYSQLSDAPGGGDQRTMIFRARGKGTTAIKLELADRYNPDVAKRMQVIIRVSE